MEDKIVIFLFILYLAVQFSPPSTAADCNHSKKDVAWRRNNPQQTPYINHPIGVAYILWKGDVTDIVLQVKSSIVKVSSITFSANQITSSWPIMCFVLILTQSLTIIIVQSNPRNNQYFTDIHWFEFSFWMFSTKHFNHYVSFKLRTKFFKSYINQ